MPATPAHKQSAREKCSRCGRSPPHDRQQCPARDAVCHKCNKRGHFQAVCRSTVQVKEVQLDSSEASFEDKFLGVLTEQGEAKPSSPWGITLRVNGKPTLFEIDTGAEVSVVSRRTHQQIGKPPLRPQQKTLRGPCEQVLPVKGEFTGKMCLGNREVEQQLYVLENLRKNLLGRPAIEALELVAHVRPIQDTKESLIERFPSLFSGLGKLEGEYSIKLQEGARPFALTVPRRVAIPLMQPVQSELERMERLGVIARVNQPTEWCAGNARHGRGAEGQQQSPHLCGPHTSQRECV